jgi:hypothetical protein
MFLAGAGVAAGVGADAGNSKSDFDNICLMYLI